MSVYKPFITSDVIVSPFKVNKSFTFNGHANITGSGIDIFTGTTSIMEYKEQYIKNPCTFDELERFISIYNPSEVILLSNLSCEENNDIINYVNIRTNRLTLFKKSLKISYKTYSLVLKNLSYFDTFEITTRIYCVLPSFFCLFDRDRDRRVQKRPHKKYRKYDLSSQ
jgi:DNA mismatch repair ATPase MutS